MPAVAGNFTPTLSFPGFKKKKVLSYASFVTFMPAQVDDVIVLLFCAFSFMLLLQDLANCLCGGLSIYYHEVQGTFFWLCAEEFCIK